MDGGATMIKERVSSTVPHYCPHRGCHWSFVGTQKQADGYLAVHIRVVHKGDDPRPATVASADADAALRQLERRKAKTRRAEKLKGPTSGESPAAGDAPRQPDAGSIPAGSTSTDPAPPGDAEQAARAGGGSASPGGVLRGPVRDTACRTEGCENRANARYTRGPLSRLCWEECIPRTQQEMSRRIQASKAAARAARGDAPAAQPPAAPAPAPVAAVDAHTRTTSGDGSHTIRISTPPGLVLVDLARRAARGRRDMLAEEQRYLELLRAVAAHPDYPLLAPIFADAADRL